MNYNRNLFQQINRLTNEVTGSYRSYTPPEPPVVTDTVTITTEPTDITCYIGDTATLSIVAVSDDETATLSYQWQILDNETWLNVSGATLSSYVVPTSGLKEDSYRCQVTSDKGGSATSTTATVTVQEVPIDTVTITTQPQTTTGYIGDTITLSVVAESDDETATLSYQWQRKDGSTYEDITDATSSTYTVNTTYTGTERYRVIVTSDKGGTATSNYADVTISADTVTISVQPSNATAFVGDTVTLSVTASSDVQGATLSYQWKADGTDISGATSSTYTAPTSSTGSVTYTGVITSDKGGTATSDSAVVTVSNDTVTISAQPQTTSGYVGDTITLSVTASSNNPNATLSYQWQNYGEGWTDILGATSSTYTVDTSSVSTRQYRCVINSTTGGTATSDSAIITIAEKPQIFLVAPSNSSETVDSNAYFDFNTITSYMKCYLSFMDNDINTAVARGTSKGITTSVIMSIPGAKSNETMYTLASISSGSGTISSEGTNYSQNSLKISSSPSASKNKSIYFRHPDNTITRANAYRLYPLTYGVTIGTISIPSGATTKTVSISNINSSAVTGSYTMCDVYLYIIDGGLNVVTSGKTELNNCPKSTTVDIDVSMLSATGAYKAVGFCVYNSLNAANSGSYICSFLGAVNVVMQ